MPNDDYLFRSGSILTTRERLRRLAASEIPSLHARPTRAERVGWVGVTVAALAVCASLGFAVVAATPASPARGQSANSEDAAPIPMTTAPASAAPTTFAPAPPVIRMPPLPATINPLNLNWDDLTLMLRAGLRDDEVIAEIDNKPLVFSLDPTREQILRSLGAGSQLLAYLRGRRVYIVPAMTPARRVAASAPPAPLAMAAPATVYRPPPTPDYAARDRQIADLKQRIEAIDEKMRQARANPQRYGFIRNSTDTSRQQSSDAYLAQLDQERNDLRRQKWQLEGR